jgi:hypothetical protein
MFSFAVQGGSSVSDSNSAERPRAEPRFPDDAHPTGSLLAYKACPRHQGN